jgi:signal transduction histidine kinase
MKMDNQTEMLVSDKPAFSVKPLIDQIIRVILHNSIQKGTFIMNEVNPELKTKSDLKILALVFGNLIKDAISFSENDCLRISSTDDGEIIIKSKKSDLAKNRSFMVSVDSLQIITERMGSGVSISGSFNNGVQIFIRFNKNAA